MSDPLRRACVADLHRLASGMPHVRVTLGTGGNPVYSVGGRSFVFFRNPRPDAVDPQTGQRYRDVIVLWVPSEADKQALIQNESLPFFTTRHFDGHPSVLIRAGRLDEVTAGELAEVVQDAWLSRASPRRATLWLGEQADRMDHLRHSGTTGTGVANFVPACGVCRARVRRARE